MELAIINLETQNLCGIAEFEQSIPVSSHGDLEFHLFLAKEFELPQFAGAASDEAFVYRYKGQTILGLQKPNAQPRDILAFVPVLA